MAFGRSNSARRRIAALPLFVCCVVMLAAAAAVATAAGPAGSPDDTYFSVSPPPAVPGDPNIGTMQDYLAGEDENVAPLGIAVRADERTLSSGEKQSGLLVISVDSGGPAAKAGLKSTHRKIKTVVEAASIAGALFFPPAMMVVPLLEATKAGESYDLIVGVDGNRVTDVLDFEDCLRDLQPGEIVYLSIVRNGQRVQLPVPMPPAPES